MEATSSQGFDKKIVFVGKYGSQIQGHLSVVNAADNRHPEFSQSPDEAVR